jgi:hypothetical protein
MEGFEITQRRNSGLKHKVETKLYLNDIIHYQKKLSLLEKMAKMEAKRKNQSEKIQEVC